MLPMQLIICCHKVFGTKFLMTVHITFQEPHSNSRIHCYSDILVSSVQSAWTEPSIWLRFKPLTAACRRN
jgi:mannose/fructose-specific phosphotransferase system component IIA